MESHGAYSVWRSLLSWDGRISGVDVLRREVEAYERMKEELLKRYRGKVVVIKDGRLEGVYDSEEEAFRSVVEKYGLVPVLIKRVEERERPEEIPAYTYGFLNVILTEQ